MVEPRLNIVPVTLCDGDYHLGVAGLVNSLHRVGFRGTMLVGYRGALPGWTAGARTLADGMASLDIGGIELRWVEIAPGPNLAMLKPQFMADALDKWVPQADVVAFIDADIVITGRWDFFAAWAQCGVGLCLDMSFPIMPEGHPHRHAWQAALAAHGRSARPLSWYFNSGFILARRQDRALIDLWRTLLAERVARAGSVRTVKIAERHDPFAVPDQDTLNAAAMGCDVPLSALGPDGMGFTPAGFAMLHAVAGKPWRGGYLRRALRGFPPGAADKGFWASVDGPVRPFSAMAVAYQRLAMRIAAAIGRFYRRSA